MKHLTLRRRLALVCAAAVALVVVLGSVVGYGLVRASLRGEIDDSLRAAARSAARLPPPVAGRVLALRDPLAGPAIAAQVVTPGGDLLQPAPGVARFELPALPPTTSEGYFEDRDISGVHARVHVVPIAEGFSLQLARSLTEVDEILADLRIGLGIIALLGIALAAVLGRLASQTAVRPVAELTDAAEHVAATRDLSRRITDGREDELGRLARSFNTMLEALDRSQRAQRRLVADASHELRTPLTSLRTNLEVLDSNLEDADRERLRADLVAQLEELTLLVGDLVDLARDDERTEDIEELRLDELVRRAVDRARRHSPEVDFECALVPCVVRAAPGRLDRAVANLLDNAAKFAGGSGPVEVRVQDGELVVRDHGPGIAEADLPHVFDRFYRADSARGRPGSGLGLAIVRQVAEAHGARVSAEAAPGGGALMRLSLRRA